MIAKEVRILERWTVAPGFRSQSVAEAALALAKLLPNYPGPDDQPEEICHKGNRWFREEMEAVADAIYREARRPDASTRPMTGSAWARKRNSSGLWALPGLLRAAEADPGADPQHVMIPE